MSESHAAADEPKNLLDESRLEVVREPFPRIVLQLLTSGGELHTVVLGPMLAHQLSDDLLRAAVECKRREPRIAG